MNTLGYIGLSTGVTFIRARLSLDKVEARARVRPGSHMVSQSLLCVAGP